MNKKEMKSYYDGLSDGLNVTLAVLRILLDSDVGFFGKIRRRRNIRKCINSVTEMLKNTEELLNAL